MWHPSRITVERYAVLPQRMLQTLARHVQATHTGSQDTHLRDKRPAVAAMRQAAPRSLSMTSPTMGSRA